MTFKWKPAGWIGILLMVWSCHKESCSRQRKSSHKSTELWRWCVSYLPKAVIEHSLFLAPAFGTLHFVTHPCHRLSQWPLVSSQDSLLALLPMSFSDTKIKKLILVLDLYRAITLSFYSDFHVRLDTGMAFQTFIRGILFGYTHMGGSFKTGSVCSGAQNWKHTSTQPLKIWKPKGLFRIIWSILSLAVYSQK